MELGSDFPEVSYIPKTKQTRHGELRFSIVTPSRRDKEMTWRVDDVPTEIRLYLFSPDS